MDDYSVGSLVRIVRPEEYEERTGLHSSPECALDYFADQICSIVEIKPRGMTLSLLNENFVNNKPKYKNSHDYRIGDFVWNKYSVEPVALKDTMTENEYNNVLFGV